MQKAISAAGYKDLSALVNEPIYSKLMEYHTYRMSSVSQWTTPTPFQGVKELGATIKIGIEPTVKIHSYQKNQTLEQDQAEGAFRTITFNQAFYYNVKYDVLDTDNTIVRQYLNNLTERAGKAMSQTIDPLTIRNAMSHILPHNRGGNAGSDHNINLGTVASPLAVNGTNIINLFVNAAMTLQNTPSGSEWEEGNMFILLPTMAKISLGSSPFADICCASGRTSILLGGTLPNIAGFDVIFYEAQIKQGTGPTPSYPVLFGSKNAVAYHQASVLNEFIPHSERSFGRYNRGLMINGVGTVFPKKLGLATATFTA